MTGLRRTGQLADDFFLMVHDDLSHRPRLSSRILGLGLAGALLGELALLGTIDVWDGTVVVTTGRPPQTALADEVLHELEDEPRLAVGDWLDYLGQQAVQRVAGRLEAQGLVRLRSSRLKVLRAADRWLPVDVITAGWPAIDVKLKVFNGRADSHHLMLLGLARATALNHPSLWEVRDRLQDPAVLEQTLEPLGQRPPLLELLAHIEAAVGSAVTSQRIG